MLANVLLFVTAAMVLNVIFITIDHEGCERRLEEAYRRELAEG